MSITVIGLGYVGHRYQRVGGFLSDAGVSVIELSDQILRTKTMEAVAGD